MSTTQEAEPLGSLLTKIVVTLSITGILGAIALVTRVEVLATRVVAVEATLSLRAEDGERLARIEQKIEALTDLMKRVDRESEGARGR